MGLSKKRINNVKAYLASSNLDGMYVTNLTNVRYLTGFTGSAGSVLILEKNQYFPLNLWVIGGTLGILLFRLS